mgnify:CR=1 FL=1
MHSIPREQHSPLLAAALPGTESEAFLVSRDNAIATLAACSSARISDVFRLKVGVMPTPPPVKPKSVRPPPKVTKGYERIELVVEFCNCASNAWMASEFA